MQKDSKYGYWELSHSMPQSIINSFSVAPSIVVPAAYSQYSVVRLVEPTYAGSALKVRRASDNTTSDIGFSAGLVDSAAVATFCGASNGFIDTLYDQTGNARHMSQATLGAQPKIYNGATMTTRDGYNVMQFDGSNDIIQMALDAGFTGESSWFLVFSSDTLQSGTYPASGRKTTDFTIFETQGAMVNYRLHMAVPLCSTNFDPIDKLFLATLTFADTSRIQRNADTPNLSGPGQTITAALGVVLGGHPGGFAYANSEISEFQVWTPALGAVERDFVRDNINAFYAIY